MLENFRKIYFPDNENLNRVQDNIATAWRRIVADVLLNRITVTADIAATNTTIVHNLGRTPVGYLIISKNANADVWTVSLARGEIVLIASAPVTVTMYLF